MSDSQEEFQADKETPFHVMWFVTKLGVKYEFPDMGATQVDSAVKQLHGLFDQMAVTNISGSCLVIPKRIIKKAGVGERCCWEAIE